MPAGWITGWLDYGLAGLRAGAVADGMADGMADEMAEGMAHGMTLPGINLLSPALASFLLHPCTLSLNIALVDRRRSRLSHAVSAFSPATALPELLPDLLLVLCSFVRLLLPCFFTSLILIFILMMEPLDSSYAIDIRMAMDGTIRST